MPGMKTTAYDALPPDLWSPVWQMYYSTFAEINESAAQRHMMTWEEFADTAVDRRIEKYVVTAGPGDGTPIGLGVQTTDLDAWPLISPEYFRHRWPKLYDENKIWYVGFVGVTGHHPGVFADLIVRMSAPTVAAGGVSVMDYCTTNVERGLPRAAHRILERGHDQQVITGRIDAQEFWAYDFGQPFTE